MQKRKIDLQLFVDLIRIDAINSTHFELSDEHKLGLKDGGIENSKLVEIPFHVTGQITSAAAATAVELIPNSAVPAGKKVYLHGYIAKVNGATDWATTATIKIQDKNSSAVDFVTLDASALDGNEVHLPTSDSATLEAAFYAGTGGTAAKGLQLKGNANGTGSTLIVTVWGVIK